MRTAKKETGVKEPGAGEISGKDSGVGESGVKESGIKEPGVKVSGEKEPGVKALGEKEPVSKESGSKEPAVKSPGFTEPPKLKAQPSDLSALTRDLMETLVPDDLSDVSEVLQTIGWKRTGAAYLIGSVYKKACGGDVSAAKLIKELADGEDAGETEEDVIRLSDAALYRMLRESLPDFREDGTAPDKCEKPEDRTMPDVPDVPDGESNDETNSGYDGGKVIDSWTD